MQYTHHTKHHMESSRDYILVLLGKDNRPTFPGFYAQISSVLVSKSVNKHQSREEII